MTPTDPKAKPQLGKISMRPDRRLIFFLSMHARGRVDQILCQWARGNGREGHHRAVPLATNGQFYCPPLGRSHWPLTKPTRQAPRRTRSAAAAGPLCASARRYPARVHVEDICAGVECTC